MANRISDWWGSLSYRQRCTAHALCGITVTPFMVIHAHPAFAPFILRGGYVAVLAWVGLISTYYVTIRCWVDLVTDAVDVARGEYTLKGDDISEARIRLLRTKTPPYDLVSAPDVKRDWSAWQYVLTSWTLIESVPIGWIVLIAMGLTSTKSPYMDGLISANPISHACTDEIVSCVIRFIHPFDYLFIISAAVSLVQRNAAGVMPLPLRWLGLPNWYPAQNVSPRWMNELMIKLIRRPM